MQSNHIIYYVRITVLVLGRYTEQAMYTRLCRNKKFFRGLLRHDCLCITASFNPVDYSGDIHGAYPLNGGACLITQAAKAYSRSLSFTFGWKFYRSSGLARILSFQSTVETITGPCTGYIVVNSPPLPELPGKVDISCKWTTGDSNPEPSGYEPPALTSWANGP